MKNLFNITILSALAILTPLLVFGANVQIQPTTEHVYVGDVVVLRVTLDTEGKQINVVEGDINIKKNISDYVILDINTGSSDLSLWPRSPSVAENTISFTGGIPRGINSDQVKLFEIVMEARKAGSVVFSSDNLTALLNDGNGTKQSINPFKFEINIENNPTGISANEWQKSLSEDRKPPQSFSVVSGSDSSIFDGKKFIAFYTSDKESGVDYYEVKEGNLPAIRASSPYVLQNQDEKMVVVTAYDKAGNKREEKYSSQSMLVQFLVIAALIIFAWAYFYWLRRKKENEL